MKKRCVYGLNPRTLASATGPRPDGGGLYGRTLPTYDSTSEFKKCRLYGATYKMQALRRNLQNADSTADI